jgi:hypothetical protein
MNLSKNISVQTGPGDQMIMDTIAIMVWILWKK